MLQIVCDTQKITIDETQDFIGEGGEGKLYVKDGISYKIYHDETDVIPEGKLRELSVLEYKDRIIYPQHLVYKPNGRVIGCSMKFVSNATELCRLFNSVYLKNNGITRETIGDLVLAMQETIQFIHTKNILVVDMNEMNFLVLESKISEPRFIDVNNYQTQNYPALAISPMVYDPLSKVSGEFTTKSDWYSFAILSCQLFLGIHPYRGTHPKYAGRDIEQRMIDHISVFNDDTKLPRAARDTSWIPSAYRQWLMSILEDGNRDTPPQKTGTFGSITYATVKTQDSIVITCITQFTEDIRQHVYIDELRILIGSSRMKITDTRTSQEKTVKGDFSESVFLVSPQSRRLCRLYLKQNRLQIDIPHTSQSTIELSATRVLSCGDPLIAYVCSSSKITAISLTEISDKVVVSVGISWKIVQHSKIFDGILVESAFNSTYVLLPRVLSGSPCCYRCRVEELDHVRVIDAWSRGTVAVCVVERSGKYYRFILKFSTSFETYTVMETEIDTPIMNCELAGQTLLCLTEGGDIELYSSRIDSHQNMIITNHVLKPDMPLSIEDKNVMCIHGARLYHVSMI